MIDPLGYAREVTRQSEVYQGSGRELHNIREALRSLTQHGEEMERRFEYVEARLKELEEFDRPASGILPTMGGDE